MNIENAQRSHFHKQNVANTHNGILFGQKKGMNEVLLHAAT